MTATSLGFTLYAAMAAHRAQDPALMCRILGCHPTCMEWHVDVFDRSGAFLDSVNLAALRIQPRIRTHSNTLNSGTRTSR